MDRRQFFTFSLLGLVSSAAQAQGLKLPKPPKIPGLKIPDFNGEQFIKHTPPLTTNLADVYEAVPGFDAWEPKDAAPLTLIPRDESGDYLVLPGLFELVAESFCLKAGSNPPSRNKGNYGNGYLYAPLKGPKAEIIERILRRSEDFPTLPQHEVQLLLWAIIAESKLSECPKNIQKTAQLLLEDKQRLALENDVLAVVPTQLRGKVYGSLPPLVKEALEAENRMRERLAQAFSDVSGTADALVDSVSQPGQKVSALYNEMETIAMRVGDLPEASEAEKVPWGRWSWHPDGFFLRILPSGYSTTTRQLYYPEVFTFQGNKIIAPDGTVYTVTGAATVPTDAAALQKLFVSTPEGAETDALRNVLARAAMSALAKSKYRVALTDYQDSVCGRFGSGFGGGGGGGAGMGRPGSQRLGQSRKPKDPPSIEKARNATKALKTFGGQATKGLQLPFFMTDKLLNWQFDMAGAIDRALNGEDGGHVNGPGCSWESEPEAVCGQGDEGLGIISLPRPKRVAVGKNTPALTAARDSLSDALARLIEVGRARLTAEKRYNMQKTAENGRVLVALRRRWGLSQLAVADSGEKLVKIYQAAGGEDSGWDEAAWSAQLTRWRSQEDSSDDKAAAHAVGMTDAEIADSLADRRALTEKDRPQGGMFDSMSIDLCNAFRESGMLYARLPEPPSRPAGQGL